LGGIGGREEHTKYGGLGRLRKGSQDCKKNDLRQRFTSGEEERGASKYKGIIKRTQDI